MHTREERNAPELRHAQADVVRVTRSGVRWQMLRAFAPGLDSALNTTGEVVKQSPAKLVARHTTAAGSYFIKQYRHDAFALRPLKFFFKASQARREWRLAAELERRGIAVVPHVALGERWSARGLLDSFLVTEAFDGVPVNEAANLDPSLVVNFVRKLVDARVRHTDLHPANLLVNESRKEIRLVDLDGVKLADAWSPDLIEREMLAQLCVTMPLPVPEEVRQLGISRRKHALAARSKRCLKTNRDFARQQHGGLHWHVRLDALSEDFRTALASPDDFLAAARLLKNGRSSTVAAANGLVLKRFNFRRWLRPLKDLFREPRARQAFRKAYHLELCGIATARPLAAADERRCGLVIRGFVFTAELAPAENIVTWKGDHRMGARAVARLLARLHDEGFSHRDLKETNILFDAAGQPWLIDLEGVKFQGAVPHETARTNLFRLAEGVREAGLLSRSNLVTFLVTYCRARRLRPRQLFPRR